MIARVLKWRMLIFFILLVFAKWARSMSMTLGMELYSLFHMIFN